jgi:predicted ArsR family transcriptional regulator
MEQFGLNRSGMLVDRFRSVVGAANGAERTLSLGHGNQFRDRIRDLLRDIADRIEEVYVHLLLRLFFLEGFRDTIADLRLSEKHPRRADTLNLLAKVYRETRRRAEAKRASKTAEAIEAS